MNLSGFSLLWGREKKNSRMERLHLKQIRDPTMTPDMIIINGKDGHERTVSQCAHEVLLKMSLSKKRKKTDSNQEYNQGSQTKKEPDIL